MLERERAPFLGREDIKGTKWAHKFGAQWLRDMICYTHSRIAAETPGKIVTGRILDIFTVSPLRDRAALSSRPPPGHLLGHLDLYWASPGPLLDPSWTSAGPLLDLHWTSGGPLLDLLLGMVSARAPLGHL